MRLVIARIRGDAVNPEEAEFRSQMMLVWLVIDFLSTFDLYL